MEFVCKDPSGDTWHYEAGKFIRMNGDKLRSKISAEYIPDPYKLWEMKSNKAGSSICTPQYRPSDATFALFKYKEGLENA